MQWLMICQLGDSAWLMIDNSWVLMVYTQVIEDESWVANEWSPNTNQQPMLWNGKRSDNDEA